MLYFYSDSPKKTKKLGVILGNTIIKIKKREKALVVGLEGNLGSGKTTFIQGLASGLGIKEKIISPTFVILRKFRVHTFTFKTFYHFDCYRLKNPKEILDLDFKKAVSDSQNILVIEWVDRISKILPRDTLMLKFGIINQNTREIEFGIMRKVR